MKVRYPFEKEEYVYGWDDIEKVDYYPVYYGSDLATYTFTFKDGITYDIKETGHFLPIRSKFKMMLSENDIPYRNMSSGHVIK